MNHSSPEQENRRKFFSLIADHLGMLYDHIRSQITYFESIGDLLPGEFSVDGTVDAVLVQAYYEFVKHKEPGDFGSWLKKLADKKMRRDVKRVQAERGRAVSIDEDIPEIPPDRSVTTLGEEVLEFYQPDEDLKLEDIFPDTNVSSPEDFVAAKQDLLHCVNAALAGMPREWRRAMRLRYARGLTGEELSHALEKNLPAVEQLLDHAREHLRQTLIEAGCTFVARQGTAREKRADGP